MTSFVTILFLFFVDCYYELHFLPLFFFFLLTFDTPPESTMAFIQCCISAAVIAEG